MADLDNTTNPLKRIGTTALSISDGAGTPLSVSGVFEGGIQFTINGRAYAEARSQGRFKSTPVAVETTDGVSTLEIEGKITTFKGDSNAHVYEMLTRTGNALTAATTGAGDAMLYQVVLTFIQAVQTGAVTQTLTFAYCHCDTLTVTASTEDSVSFSATFTNLENVPTAA